MSNFGAVESAALLIVIVLLAEWFRLRGSGPTLVLQEFRVDATRMRGEFLCIRGRQSGLVPWLMSRFGLHPVTILCASDMEVTRETVGPHGFETLYAPLCEISSSRCSYYRAFGLLILSVAFYIYGLSTLGLAMLTSNDYLRLSAVGASATVLWTCAIGGTVFYVLYALSKRVLISFVTHGEVTLGIAFKRSAIENVGVELKRAVEAVDVINARILARKLMANEPGGDLVHTDSTSF